MKPMKLINVATMVTTLMLSLNSTANAQQLIPADLAVKAILGEAENQNYRGMLAVACGIRNRGTLQGVYGVTAKRPNTPGLIDPKYWVMAKRAWAESEKNRIHPAKYWDNAKEFGTPEWAKGMKIVYVYKDHVYYAPSKRQNRKGAAK